MTDSPPKPTKQERAMWPARLRHYIVYLEGVVAGNRVVDLELPPNHEATKTEE